MKCAFSIDFSMIRGPNKVLTPLKRTAKRRLPEPLFGMHQIATKKTSEDHQFNILRVCCQFLDDVFYIDE